MGAFDTALKLLDTIAVMNGVQEDVGRRGGAREVRGPLPLVVFRVEEEVGAHGADTQGDDDQDDVDKEHDAVNVVDLVIPEAREDKVVLYSNSDSTTNFC